MKTTIAGLSLILALSAHGQGPLLPPGAPGETMKSLDQIEPRIPLSAAPINITNAGSYYLTTDLFGTVSINADDVTLDLMGFTIAPTAGEAIDFPSARRNIVVRNGTLRSASTALDARELVDANCLFEGIRAYSNSFAGIYAGSGCVIRDCDVWANTTYGIRIIRGTNSVVQNCRITDNPQIGLALEGTGTYVAGNIVRGNGDNYNLSQGNQLNLLLCQIPETLDWPCSVTLAGTLTCSLANSNGITVTTNDVTIDLAGHALVGPGANSGHGIYQGYPLRNLTVLNGKVANWRGSSKIGVYAWGESSQIYGVQAATNDTGINGGNGSIISRCSAQCNAGYGIYTGGGSTLRDCTASFNNYGIGSGGGSAFSGCSAHYNTGNGISTSIGSALVGCAAFHNNLGIYAFTGCTLRDCTASFNTGDGIQITSNCQVNACMADANGHGGDGAGIHATGGRNRMDGNHVTGNVSGINVDAAGNIIVRNSASGNTANYAIVGGNSIGTISGSPIGAGAWDNFVF